MSIFSVFAGNSVGKIHLKDSLTGVEEEKGTFVKIKAVVGEIQKDNFHKFNEKK